MRSPFPQTTFTWLIVAALASAAIAYGLIGDDAAREEQIAAAPLPAAEADRALSRVRETHQQIDEFLDRRESEAEARARAHAQAREAARLAAIREAEEKREHERRVAEAAAARDSPRADVKAAPPRRVAQKPETPAGNPLDIVPDASAAPAPREIARGPVEALVARVDEIRDKAVSAVGGIRDWLVDTTGRILSPGRERFFGGTQGMSAQHQ